MTCTDSWPISKRSRGRTNSPHAVTVMSRDDVMLISDSFCLTGLAVSDSDGKKTLTTDATPFGFTMTCAVIDIAGAFSCHSGRVELHAPHATGSSHLQVLTRAPSTIYACIGVTSSRTRVTASQHMSRWTAC
jgi:hypothetical protein